MPPKARATVASKRDGLRSTQGPQLPVAAPLPQPHVAPSDGLVARQSRSRATGARGGGAKGRAASAVGGALALDSAAQLDSQAAGSVDRSRRQRGSMSVPPLEVSGTEPEDLSPLRSMAIRMDAVGLDVGGDIGRPAKSSARRTAREAVPPTYDGTTSSFNDYLQDFLRVADFNGWDSNDRAFHLSNSVTGNAKIKVKALPYTSEFAVLMQQYLEVFASDRALETYRDQLSVVQRRPEQDLDTYGHVLLDLVRKANPAFSPGEQDRFARDKFMATAGSSQLIFWLRALKPKTLQGAIDLALQFEAASSTSRVAKPAAGASPKSTVLSLAAGPQAVASASVASAAADVQPSASPTKTELYKVLKDLSGRLAKFEGQMKALQSGQSGATGAESEKGGGKKGSITCYGCGEKGHIKRLCPRRKPADERSATGAPRDQKPLN